MQVFIALSCLLAVASASWGHQGWGNQGVHIPVISNGVPVDTPEVQHARAAHAQAHAQAQGGQDNGQWGAQDNGQWGGQDNGQWSGQQSSGAWAHAQHVPVISNGVPVDTPEVQHARAAHAQAHAQAQGGQGVASWAGQDNGQWNGQDNGQWSGQDDGQWSQQSAGSWANSQQVPVIGHGGVPQDTPEVAHAKAAHLAAVADANARSAHSARVW